MMHEVIDKKFNPLEVVDAKISNSLKRFAPAETCYDQRRNTQGPINCMVYYICILYTISILINRVCGSRSR